MFKRKRDDAKPYGKITILPDDFLPAPSELIRKESVTDIMLPLDTSTIGFLKLEASKRKIPYQKIIQNLVQQHVEQLKKSSL